MLLDWMPRRTFFAAGWAVASRDAARQTESNKRRNTMRLIVCPFVVRPLSQRVKRASVVAQDFLLDLGCQIFPLAKDPNRIDIARDISVAVIGADDEAVLAGFA